MLHPVAARCRSNRIVASLPTGRKRPSFAPSDMHAAACLALMALHRETHTIIRRYRAFWKSFFLARFCAKKQILIVIIDPVK